MRHFLAPLLLALALACGGSSSSAPQAPAPTPAPTAPPAMVVLKPASSAYVVGPAVGDPIGQLMIVESSGQFRANLDGYRHIRGLMRVYADGTIGVEDGGVVVDRDGTRTPLTLTGTRTGNTLAGTTNAGAFNLTIVDAPDAPQDLASKSGNYATTATSNGIHARVYVSPSGAIAGWAYATEEDAVAGLNPIGSYDGTLTHSDADPTHVKNIWIFGLRLFLKTDPSTPLATDGLAFFEGTSFVSLACNTTSTYNPQAGQFSARWVKLP